jgi:hypothetical protein
MAASSLPSQVPVEVHYPVTVFHTDKFDINVFFWLDATTDIHDHNFWGAFQVLAGSSLHTTHRFRASERITQDLARGELTVTGLESLSRGDVREIEAGSRFIHSLFHLDRPSVSLVVATKEDIRHRDSFTYLTPGFAYHRGRQDELLSTQLKLLDLLHRSDPGHFRRQLERFLVGSDPAYAFRGLMHAIERLESAEFDEVLELTCRAHGSKFELLPAVFEEHRRQCDIRARRALIHDAEHRFFLAVVLNAPRHADIVRLIRERFPESDPVELILRWVTELVAIEIPGADGPTALGAALDEAGLAVLKGLLRGRSGGSLLRALAESFDPADVSAQEELLLDLEQAFRDSLFYRALLPRLASS